ncbi:MAG TPA: TadE family protein [Planctomycetaceae bacterium]|nr:TadE family protein [Planctomycetaceae bacterium]
MNRAILEPCLPLFYILLGSFFALFLSIRLSGARWNLSRLKQLHTCQDGGVQSLAFVLTLPFFILIVTFILQISQLIVAMMGVHYSAYAGVRAAVVWLPASVSDRGITPHNPDIDPWSPDYNPGSMIEPPNQVVAPYRTTQDLLCEYHNPWDPPYRVTMGPQALQSSSKYRRIWTAAVLGMAPFSPSDDKGLFVGNRYSTMNSAANATRNIYLAMANEFETRNPNKTRNQANIASNQITRKIAWAERNTLVFAEWRDLHQSAGPHTLNGPTYNPWNHTNYNPQSNGYFEFQENEVGWQDPVTVHVYHRFALLPGPARWLNVLGRRNSDGDKLKDSTAKQDRFLYWDWNDDPGSDPTSRFPYRHRHMDTVDPSERQRYESHEADETGTWTIVIHGSATMNNDGLIPLFPEQQDDF